MYPGRPQTPSIALMADFPQVADMMVLSQHPTDKTAGSYEVKKYGF
jgi:hypothetical protein